MSELPEITPSHAHDAETYQPYKRDEKTLAREWAYPGMKGFEHRIGGLEKGLDGNVSHDPANHQKMSFIRQEKVNRVAEIIPELDVYGNKEGGEVLLVGWGGTHGHLLSSVRELRAEGIDVSLAHFNYIQPLPKNTEEIFSKYKKIIVCELNNGQFASYLRDKLPEFKYDKLNKLEGLPFTNDEIKKRVLKEMEGSLSC